MSKRNRTGTWQRWPVPILGLCAVLVLIVAACTSDGATPTPDPIEPAQPTPAGSPIATLELPPGCGAFDQGWWGTPVISGSPVRMELRAASCARTALDALRDSGARLQVSWTPFGVAADGSHAAAALAYDRDADRWVGEVTFPEPGRWRSEGPIGAGQWFEVGWDDLELMQPSPHLPFTGQQVVVINERLDAERRWVADTGGLGWLSDPERIVFIQPRDGGLWLVAGNVATGTVEPLAEVGPWPYSSVMPAPDGRAVAVEWGTVDGGRAFRLVASDGRVTEVMDDARVPLTVSWAPDSETLIVTGDILRLLGGDGAIRSEQPLSGEVTPGIQWAPDGSRALIRYYTAAGMRVEWLDATTGDREAVIEEGDGVELLGVGGMAITPGGDHVAVAWRDDSPSPTLSVVPVADLTADALRDAVQIRYGDGTDDLHYEIGGLSWAPDASAVAFVLVQHPLSDARRRLQDVRSSVNVLDIASGEVRVIAASQEQWYATYGRDIVWSSDGSMLFATRYPCTGCGPETAAVDAIPVAGQDQVRAFEDSVYVGPIGHGNIHLLSTPDGLVRTDGRDGGVVVYGGSTPLFGGAWTASPTHVAVVEGRGPGTALLSARPAGAETTSLGRTAREDWVLAALDAESVLVQRDGRWALFSPTTGAVEPFAAAPPGPDPGRLVVSPSGRFLLSATAEGFAILDAMDPAAAAVVPPRPYPDTAGEAAWSADERWIAFGDGFTIGVFDRESGEEHVFDLEQLGVGLDRTEDGRNRLWGITWSADDEAIEFGAGSRLWRLDVGSAQATAIADAPRPGGFTQFTILSRSPDRQSLVAATAFGVFVLDEDTTTWSLISRAGVGHAGRALAWAPDGTAVAYGASEVGSSRPLGIVIAPLDGGAYQFVAPGFAQLLGWMPGGEVLWALPPAGP